MDTIAESKSPIRITGNMVLLSEEEYEKLLKAKENAEYLAKLDERIERLNNGEGIHKTMEELRAME